MELPPTVLETLAERGFTPRDLSSCFLSPPRREVLRDLTMDPATGRLRPLTPTMLAELARHGTITIPSVAMPDNPHRFQVSGVVQTGSDVIFATLVGRLTRALSLVVSTVPQLLLDTREVSVASGVVEMARSVSFVADYLVGLPHYRDGSDDFNLRMSIARARWLVKDLQAMPDSSRVGVWTRFP
jgi:hypothetical protein